MSTIMYGIKNCDTIKKARKWLDEAGIEYRFHDVRKDGITSEKIDTWLASVSWEILLNKRGTTWRQLPDDVKNTIDETSAKHIMLENPAIIKRPVLDANGKVFVGFKAAEYEAIFK